jgi:hypothetical protein
MISIKDFLDAIDYKISEGGDYHYAPYGTNAYTLDSWDGKQDGYSAGVVFDKQTQEVYEVSICDYKKKRAYKLVNKEYDPTPEDLIAWEGINYILLETADDFFEKLHAIIEGEEYDTSISVPINISDAELLILCKLAHEKDLSLNAYINLALATMVKDIKSKGTAGLAEDYKAYKTYMQDEGCTGSCGGCSK